MAKIFKRDVILLFNWHHAKRLYFLLKDTDSSFPIERYKAKIHECETPLVLALNNKVSDLMNMLSVEAKYQYYFVKLYYFAKINNEDTFLFDPENPTEHRLRNFLLSESSVKISTESLVLQTRKHKISSLL